MMGGGVAHGLGGQVVARVGFGHVASLMMTFEARVQHTWALLHINQNAARSIEAGSGIDWGGAGTKARARRKSD